MPVEKETCTELFIIRASATFYEGGDRLLEPEPPATKGGRNPRPEQPVEKGASTLGRSHRWNDCFATCATPFAACSPNRPSPPSPLPPWPWVSVPTRPSSRSSTRSSCASSRSSTPRSWSTSTRASPASRTAPSPTQTCATWNGRPRTSFPASRTRDWPSRRPTPTTASRCYRPRSCPAITSRCSACPHISAAPCCRRTTSLRAATR